MIPQSVLIKFATLGLNADQAATVAAMLSDVEAATKGEAAAVVEVGREKARARWHKWKTNGGKRLQPLANDSQQLASASPAHDLENKQTNKKENKKGRATRLTPDWQTPEEWIDEAVAAGLSRAEALTEANRMKNWSVSTTGAVKLDWHATWQNWFLRFLETRGSQRTHPPPPAKGVVGAAQRMMEKSNGSESIFGSGGNGKLISSEPNDEPGRTAEYLQGGLGRRYLSGNH